MGSFFYFTLIFLFCFFEFLYAEWVAIPGPKPYDNYLAVTWPYDGTVLVAGYQVSGGNILISQDYGVTWTSLNTTDGSTFGSLYSLVSSTISSTVYYLAVDDSGNIFGATGNGQSWSLYSSAPTQLYGATFGSNGYAFVCGYNNKIYRSSTASSFQTWSSVGPSIGTVAQFNDISTINGVNVIVVGSRGFVYYSSSSGASGTWTAGSSGISGTSAFIYCVKHITTTSALAGGSSGYLAKTTDGGATWTKITLFASTATIRFHTISVITVSSSTYVYVTASSGSIYWSTDQGSSFSLLVSTGSTLYSLAMYDLNHGAIAGVGVYTLVPSKIFLIPSYLN